ncbi:karyopherin beta [Cryptosporidium xiaoi]|uniref:Karyopherin beta n=1 Tax=Cryptosporidium xiaoi TaxID=659607 RepID=A0AAV9Y0S2_9CRYT
MDTLCKLYEGFSSSDSSIRQESEDQFNNLKQSDPNTFLQLTLSILQQQPNSQFRVQAAISLRNVFREFVLTPDNCTWNKITPENQSVCLDTLLKCLETEQVNVVSMNLSDTVSLVAMELFPSGKWPNLLPFLFRLITNLQNFQASGSAPESVTIPARHAFRIVSEIMPVLDDVISSHRDSIVSTINTALQFPDVEIRFEAIGLISSIVESNEKKNWAPLVPLIPLILETLHKLISAQHTLVLDVLYRLTTISESDPAFYKQHFPVFFPQILNIAKNAQLSTDVRQAAIECLLCIVETRPVMCTKHPSFVNDMVSTLLSFMLEFDDDPNWAEVTIEQEENDLESEIDDDDSLYPIGEEGIDRLARALDADSFIPVFYHFITIYMQETTAHPWKYRYAAIMAIAQTIEYIPEDDDNYQDRIGQIISRVLGFLQDQFPRVRFACCQTIGQISLDHSPFIQEAFHSSVIPQLIQAIDDPVSKVSSHALSALINFTEEVTAEDLQPYVCPLMEKLLGILNKQPQPPRIVREQCITMLAVIAGVIENDFTPYYSTIVPYLKKTMSEASPQLRTLKGKCIECLTIIGFSIDYNIFKNDAQEVMMVFLQLLGTGLKGDDPLKEYLQEALQRMCRIMKQDFVPYLPHLLPGIFTILETREDTLTAQLLNSGGSNSEIDIEKNEGNTFGMLSARDFIGMRTSLVLDMESSLDILITFIDVLGSNYHEYIANTIKVIHPLIRFSLSDEIKEKSYNVLSGLLKIMRELAERDNNIRAQFSQVMSELITLFLSVLDEECRSGTIDSQVIVINGVQECLDSFGSNVLSDDQVGMIASRCFDMLQQSFIRRNKLDEKSKLEVIDIQTKQDVDDDDDDRRCIEEEKEQEQELRLNILGILGVLMKYYPNIYWGKVGNVTVQLVSQHIVKVHNNVEDRILGFHLSADVFQYLCPMAYQHCAPWIRHILEGINDPIASIQQNCAYSLSQAAKLDSFSNILNDALQVLLLRLQSKTKGKSFNLAKDNCTNVLGNIIAYHQNSISNIHEIVNLWISLLPMKYDTDEAQNSHTTLMNLVESKNSHILGPNLENFPRILGIFIDIYGTSMSNDTLNSKIKLLIAQTGPNNLQNFATKLSKRQTDKLLKLCQ